MKTIIDSNLARHLGGAERARADEEDPARPTIVLAVLCKD